MANAFGRHRGEHDRRGIGVFARQDSGRDVDERDVAAEPAKGLGQLAADRARADDDQRANRLAQIEHRFVGEVGRRVDAGKARYRGPRSGGDDEGLRRELPSVDLERIPRDEPAGAEDDVDSETAEALGAVVRLDPLDDGGDALHHLSEIGVHGRGRERPSIGMTHLMGNARGLDQGLRGHAAVPQAIAAQPVLFDERDLRAERSAARGDDETAGAAADHHDVEFGSCHRTSWGSAVCPVTGRTGSPNLTQAGIHRCGNRR